MLSSDGIDAVKVMSLAQRLNLTRTGFYWFFENISEMHDAMIERWEGKNTCNLVASCRAEAETITQQLRQQEALAKLKSAHPDFDTIARDQGFVDWVTKSKFRIEMLRKADKEYDFEAADELLSSWKERQNMVTEAANTETKARKDSVKKASTGNTKGSAEAPSRKIYRRADIIKLMQKDPDRYMALAEEIRNAYAEGRVR